MTDEITILKNLIDKNRVKITLLAANSIVKK